MLHMLMRSNGLPNFLPWFLGGSLHIYFCAWAAPVWGSHLIDIDACANAEPETVLPPLLRERRCRRSSLLQVKHGQFGMAIEGLPSDVDFETAMDKISAGVQDPSSARALEIADAITSREPWETAKPKAKLSLGQDFQSLVLQDDTGAQQQEALSTASDHACAATFQEMSGEDVSDMDISGENEYDLDAKCCSACSANAKCDFWVRESESSGTVICWLKASKTGESPLQNANRRGGWNKVKLLQDASPKLSGSGTLGAKEGPSGVMMQHDAKKKLSGLSGRAMLDSEAYKQKLKQETSMMKEKRDAYDWRVELQKILDEA
mmetsp:Transcript_18859/g.35159  ORF Transcript_18859/g.35159 Transcript_18859/m.35159 type:complete len:320 (-) Transcript_18859:139-1098(-)